MFGEQPKTLMRLSRLFLVVALCGFLGFSQTGKAQTPDFSGSWRFDRSPSKNVESRSRFDDLTLVVSQSAAEIRITRTLTTKGKQRIAKLAYYTDERGEKNRSIYGDTRESKSAWHGNKFVSEFTVRSTVFGSSGAETYIQPARDIWEISNDGKRLVITTQIDEVKGLPYLAGELIKAEI